MIKRGDVAVSLVGRVAVLNVCPRGERENEVDHLVVYTLEMFLKPASVMKAPQLLQRPLSSMGTTVLLFSHLGHTSLAPFQ